MYFVYSKNLINKFLSRCPHPEKNRIILKMNTPGLSTMYLLYFQAL